MPSFISSSPAPFWIIDSSKSVYQGVRIWRDIQTMVNEIITCICNDGQCIFRSDIIQAPAQFCPTYAAT